MINKIKLVNNNIKIHVRINLKVCWFMLHAGILRSMKFLLDVNYD